jgi:N-acetylglucosamine-6-phosphate deacetylase
MKILDPHLKDGVHEWRDGKRFVKEGAKLYLEGTDTLAGRFVQVPRWRDPYQPLVTLVSSP